MTSPNRQSSLDPMQPTSTDKKPFRWSFSQWENYDGCPARWHFKSVLKLSGRPAGPAAARGLDLHDRVERYINGDLDLHALTTADPNVKFGTKGQAIVAPKYIEVLDSFRNHNAANRHTEYKMAMDEEFHLCSPLTQMAACISVLDAQRYIRPDVTVDSVVEIAEWKSGSPKPTHADQRKLYALFGLRGWMANEVRVTTYYLEHEDEPPQRLVVKDTAEEKLKAIWIQRVELMKSDKICAPRPGVHCNWCDYSKRNGGPCAHGS